VEQPYVSTGFFVAFTNHVPRRRKLTPHLASKLHDLRLESGDSIRQLFENLDSAFQHIYPRFKRFLRHFASPRFAVAEYPYSASVKQGCEQRAAVWVDDDTIVQAQMSDMN
jgi:hypothetical protein